MIHLVDDSGGDVGSSEMSNASAIGSSKIERDEETVLTAASDDCTI